MLPCACRSRRQLGPPLVSGRVRRELGSDVSPPHFGVTNIVCPVYIFLQGSNSCLGPKGVCVRSNVVSGCAVCCRLGRGRAGLPPKQTFRACVRLHLSACDTCPIVRLLPSFPGGGQSRWVRLGVMCHRVAIGQVSLFCSLPTSCITAPGQHSAFRCDLPATSCLWILGSIFFPISRTVSTIVGSSNKPPVECFFIR